MNYTNPCLQKTVNDWPSGRYRVTAQFSIERHPTRGERSVRTTLHPLTGRPSIPKTTTYARQVRIVDGDDGHTYIIEQSPYSDGISVMQGNMKYQQEVLYPDNPRYAAVAALFAV